ncbi:MAG: permease-like cell division protein FtsX [bacterium]
MGFTNLKRIISQTAKQIKRSGWMSIASILVMSLAIFISTIFLFLAFVSNLFLQSIENEPHIYAFFKVGTQEETITNFKKEWEKSSEIQFIEYTSEEQAISEFKKAQEINNPQIAQNVRANVLPPSLSIRLYRINDADKIIEMIVGTQKDHKELTTVAFNKNTIDTIKSLFFWLRLGGGIIMGLLLLVIMTFTLLTIEFRTYSRAEEIGIMQLVGGSLWFIRAPFIFEGAFYGFLGSLISSSIIYLLTYLVFVVNRQSGAVDFLYSFFGDLRWPAFHLPEFILLYFIILVVGTLIGTFNSFLAIKRYIN